MYCFMMIFTCAVFCVCVLSIYQDIRRINMAIPTSILKDLALLTCFNYAIMLLCYVKAPVCSRESPGLSFPMCSQISILHPISQFCSSAGGTSWWTTVTQPPQGILMMNSAMTFSMGNPASSLLQDADLITHNRGHYLFRLPKWFISNEC